MDTTQNETPDTTRPDLVIPGWGTVGRNDGDGVSSCGEGPPVRMLSSHGCGGCCGGCTRPPQPPANWREVQAAYYRGAPDAEVTRIALAGI